MNLFDQLTDEDADQVPTPEAISNASGFLSKLPNECAPTSIRRGYWPSVILDWQAHPIEVEIFDTTAELNRFDTRYPGGFQVSEFDLHDHDGMEQLVAAVQAETEKP